MRGWSPWDARIDIRLRCGSAPSGWSESTGTSTPRSGRRSYRSRQELECTAETLRGWVRQAERHAGHRANALTTDERQRLKDLERENRELKRANEILQIVWGWPGPVEGGRG